MPLGPTRSAHDWTIGLEQRVLDAEIEDRGGPAEPDVGLRIHPLEAQAVEDLLRAHVEPADVDVRTLGLEGVLEEVSWSRP